MTQLPHLEADVRLSGNVDEAMLTNLLAQLVSVTGKDGPLVLELTTTGGDADVGRRIALELRMLQRQRDIFFLGKTTVDSAGVMVMAAVPIERRFLTADTVLLIHERRIEKTLQLAGALRASIGRVKDVLAELENGLALERDGFEELITGSALSLDDLMSRVMTANWYLRASEAKSIRLVEGMV